MLDSVDSAIAVVGTIDGAIATVSTKHLYNMLGYDYYRKFYYESIVFTKFFLALVSILWPRF